MRKGWTIAILEKDTRELTYKPVFGPIEEAQDKIKKLKIKLEGLGNFEIQIVGPYIEYDEIKCGVIECKVKEKCTALTLTEHLSKVVDILTIEETPEELIFQIEVFEEDLQENCSKISEHMLIEYAKVKSA